MNEIVSILKARARWGLADDAIDSDQLAQIAAAAAGDARTAIGILRAAARSAERDTHDEITTNVIQEAVPKAKSEIRQADLDQLTPDQMTLYKIITDTSQISPKNLYEENQDRVTNPKTKRMIRYCLAKLEQYNLISGKGNTRGRTYEPVT